MTASLYAKDYTVLGVKISYGHDYTHHSLHWDILRWNFNVEHIEMILRHNVQYRGLLSGQPILM